MSRTRASLVIGAVQSTNRDASFFRNARTGAGRRGHAIFFGVSPYDLSRVDESIRAGLESCVLPAVAQLAILRLWKVAVDDVQMVKPASRHTSSGHRAFGVAGRVELGDLFE